MILKSIVFESYKSFPSLENFELKPITIVIGKNSSGKSAFSKLPLLLANSFTPDSEEPITVSHDGVEFGGSFEDLVYNRLIRGKIHFKMSFDNGTIITFEIRGLNRATSPIISKWSIESDILNLSLEIELTDLNLSRSKDIVYHSEDREYLITFQGLLPVSIQENGENIDYRSLDLLTQAMYSFSKNVSYIGPYRQIPKRVYFHSGKSMKKLGVKGENAPQILGNSVVTTAELVKAVGDWYEDNLGGWRIDVQQIEDFFQLVLISPDNPDVKINIVDVGQGMSQVLPLVVLCKLADKVPGAIYIVEQPELHLHPGAHGELAELFALSAKNQNSIYVLETHSENMILRLRKLIVENKFAAEDVVIYWIDDADRPGSHVKKITIDDNGELSDWPKGVFSEDYEEVLAIREAQRKKERDAATSKS